MTTAVATPAVVMMSRDEARATVEKIRASLDDIRTAALELEEREGWKALGYKSWRACVKAEFEESIATVYRQLRAAKIDRELSQLETTPVRLPTVQSEELARLPDPESRQTAYLAAKEQTGGKLTQGAVRTAVERVGQRASVRSASEAGDNQDLPADQDFPYQSDGADADFDVNNEARQGGPAEHYCSDCGGKYRGKACPCAVVPPSDQPAAAVPEKPEHPENQGTETLADDAVAPGAASDSAAPASPERPGATGLPRGDSPSSRPESQAARGHHKPVIAERSAAPAPMRQADNEGNRLMLVGDAPGPLARSLSNHPATSVVEALAEAYSAAELASLAAQIVDALPVAHVGPIAHRASVKARPSAPGVARPMFEIQAALVAELESPEQIGELVKRLVPLANLATITSLERTLPMVRKEIGARERQMAAAS